jgi:hypothetical protein
MERIVHVCNGESTADTLSLADLPGEIRVWADALDLGPVLPVADAEHYRVRGEFWAARDGHGSAADHTKRLAEWDRQLDQAAGAEELILWYEHDLFDQLALVRILARLARRPGGMPANVTLVSIDRHPDVPNFLGLGQLEAVQLAELWPRRTPLSRDAIDESVATWVALTANDPRGLPFLVKRVKAMPFLGGAIERHLEEFPDPTSGLSRTERQLLAAVARGEGTGAALMTVSHNGDPRYPITDSLVWHTLATFGRLGLVEGAPSGTPATTGDALAGINATITPAGRQVLAGAVDRVHEHGIDTWRGGVHLNGRGPVWRWHSAERRLVEK